jgi:ABC-type transport system involved in cytochrome bd biosynthesis fused ATPase/permease subunit
VLKRPVLLALDEATAVLDPAEESAILEALRDECDGRSVIAALSRPEAAHGFDRVLLMEQGKVTATGDYNSVIAPNHTPTLPLAAE